jgi:hypothetical protein
MPTDARTSQAMVCVCICLVSHKRIELSGTGHLSADRCHVPFWSWYRHFDPRNERETSLFKTGLLLAGGLPWTLAAGLPLHHPPPREIKIGTVHTAASQSPPHPGRCPALSYPAHSGLPPSIRQGTETCRRFRPVSATCRRNRTSSTCSIDVLRPFTRSRTAMAGQVAC